MWRSLDSIICFQNGRIYLKGCQLVIDLMQFITLCPYFKTDFLTEISIYAFVVTLQETI